MKSEDWPGGFWHDATAFPSLLTRPVFLQLLVFVGFARRRRCPLSRGASAWARVSFDGLSATLKAWTRLVEATTQVRSSFLSRRAFTITLTELKVIAALAIIGLRRIPKNG